VAYAYNPSTLETEVGDSGVQSQPGLPSENLSKKKKKEGRKKREKERYVKARDWSWFNAFLVLSQILG
jgi:hypothetical protein